jgi:co-chaperonin GroES (HSP10)
VLFQPSPSKEVTEMGIFIPENCRVPSNRGVIKAIGNQVTKVKVGDITYRTKLWGTEVIEDGVLYFIMTEESILAVD